MSRSGTDAPDPCGAPRTSGIVLAGGRSRRMGRDKCALALGGRTLLQRAVDALDRIACELVVVRAPGQQPPRARSRAPLRHAADRAEDAGPLAAIAAGLEAAAAPVAVAVACDLPYLRPALLRLLAARARAGAPLAAPLRGGVPQWLCAAWRRDALPALRARIGAGDRAVGVAARALGAELLPEEDWERAGGGGRALVNVNTPAQFAAARALLSR